MSLVSDITDILKDLNPAELEKLRSVATTVVSDISEVNQDIQLVLKVLPPGILHLPPEVATFEDEFTAVLSAVSAALAALATL